ncbi:MAG: Sec-independent protein translocase protein TatB, partial [Candidatus Devosia euplotis]|nr:Sec-independent protein translocase protein TatB [Candidatus Devosia euplotis]
MLGLGWTEMLVIGVMALIFIGPKDLPVVMDRIGKVAGQVRRMGADFQREINKTTGLDEVRNLRNSITGPLKKTSDEIRKEFNAMTPNGAKPSGVIKPADPAAESVVDEIRAKAGMTAPAASLSADEAAKAAGFKPAGPAASTATFGKPSGATA